MQHGSAIIHMAEILTISKEPVALGLQGFISYIWENYKKQFRVKKIRQKYIGYK